MKMQFDGFVLKYFFDMETKFYIVWAIVLILAFIVFVAFILLIIKSKKWSEREDLKQIAMAIVSSLSLLIVTIAVMGLQKQANIEEERKKADINEKMIVYRDFLNELDTILLDKKINKNEEYELQIKLSYLSLHVKKPENMVTISKAIADIVTKIKNEHNEDKGIMIELMEITDAMYEELHGEGITTQSKNQTLEDIRDEMVLEFYCINVPPEDIASYLYVVRRIRDIKKIMANKKEENNKKGNGEKPLYDKQWVYNGYTLVHDLYTDWDKREEKFVYNERPHKYAVDLKFNTKGDSVYIELFSRKNSKEETNNIIVNLIKDTTIKHSYFYDYQKDSINSIMGNGHYTYARWKTKDMNNDTIAQEITVLLKAMDKCRVQE